MSLQGSVGGSAVITGSAPWTEADVDVYASSVTFLARLNTWPIFDEVMLREADYSFEVLGGGIVAGAGKFGGGTLYTPYDPDPLATGAYAYFQRLTGFFGAGDVTAECWLNITELNDQEYSQAFLIWSDSPYVGTYIWNDGGQYKMEFWQYNAALVLDVASVNIADPTGAWVHVATVRHNGIWRVYLNGIDVGLAAPSLTGLEDLSFLDYSYVDTYTTGAYLDELRFTSGVARYTANFTPPAAPFPYRQYPLAASLSGAARRSTIIGRG